MTVAVDSRPFFPIIPQVTVAFLFHAAWKTKDAIIDDAKRESVKQILRKRNECYFGQGQVEGGRCIEGAC